MSAALQGLVESIARDLRRRGVAPPPDACLLGAQRVPLVAALQQGVLDYVAAIHWTTFYRLAPSLCPHGLDGLVAAMGLSRPDAVTAGVTAAVLATLERRNIPYPQSVLFKRLTRPTGGHIIFRSQLLQLAEGEFRTTPLELTSLLQRHTPAAIRAMLLARLIKGRPDLCSAARQTLVDHATRHLGRLLPEAVAAQHTLLLLRLTYYRVHHGFIARQVLRRLRIVDFTARRHTAVDEHARPG